jgi:hypothetical protein
MDGKRGQMSHRMRLFVSSMAFACVLIPGVAGALITGIATSPVNATAGVTFTGTVATFVESDVSFTASDYTASISWGDATSSAGVVSGGSGSFTVTGSHVYALTGSNVVTVTVQATNAFVTYLSGASQVPANASPGTGFGSVVLNPAQTQITADVTFSGLLAPATAAHIHTAPAGVNGPVTFPLAGVPAATSGVIPTQSFAITAAQLAQLVAGNNYMNVHDAVFPGGEIRGQLAPEVVTATGSATVGAVTIPLFGGAGLAAFILTLLGIALWVLRRVG